jgi:F0F1-type ATP synthase assembly protein I
MTGKRDGFYRDFKQLAILTTIPIILLIGPTIGFFVGGWIDGKLQLYPWFTITFVFLGFAAAAREIVRLLKEVQKIADSSEKK